MSAVNPPGAARTSTRDPLELEQQLTRWFERVLPKDAQPRLWGGRRPAHAGMSSETLLFDMAWTQDGVERSGGFVARLPPPTDACPLFPTYDFDLQVSVMRLVGARSRVPVPSVPWQEREPEAIGVPFFVMSRIEGDVVPDNPPYIFGGWLREATAATLERIESELLTVIAAVHGIEASAEETAFLRRPATGATPLQRHFAYERAYYEWGRNNLRFPLIEQLFDWLEGHWPEREDDGVLSWGDARPTNILWREGRAVAVLDWEEATLAPPQLDVGYTIFFHQYFRSFCRAMTGHDAMEGFLRRENVIARYWSLTGIALRDLDWYITYGLLRQSLVEIRISQRRILFGEMLRPEDPNEYLYSRHLIERVLVGDTEIWAR